MTLPVVLSSLIPGLGHLIQRRWKAGLISFVTALLLLMASMALGSIAGRAAEIVFLMLLTLPWWLFQAYDAYLGTRGRPVFLETWRTVLNRGHDIRFLGLLLLIGAFNDSWIILNNLDYFLPFYCTKPTGIPGFVTKAISPALHLVVGYGFLQLRTWALFFYLIYASYGLTNAIVNLTCFGPGRIRITLLIIIILSTAYILRRRCVLLGKGDRGSS